MHRKPLRVASFSYSTRIRRAKAIGAPNETTKAHALRHAQYVLQLFLIYFCHLFLYLKVETVNSPCKYDLHLLIKNDALSVAMYEYRVT